jgi:ParB/RepB/Spo0J family partition protein
MKRLQEIRERVARRTTEEADPTPEQPPQSEQAADAALASASAHFLGTVDQIIQNRVVQRIPVTQIAPDMRTDVRQPRLVPLPEELMKEGQVTPVYQSLVDELLELGESLKEHQIQPIIVYPGTTPTYPESRYLILVGHRRWTAARLTGLDSLDAVVIEPPEPVERLRIQYAENEQREEFSDMERAWSLDQMKRMMGAETPWEEVEKAFGISRTRRHELTRLLAFTATQQNQIALLRLPETQVRPLHQAVRGDELTPAQVDQVLERLSDVVVRHAASSREATRQHSQASDDPEQYPPPRQPRVDSSTVARMVASFRCTPTHETEHATPRWLDPLRNNLTRTSRGLQRARERVLLLDDDDATALMEDIEKLLEHIAVVTDMLRQRENQ